MNNSVRQKRHTAGSRLDVRCVGLTLLLLASTASGLDGGPRNLPPEVGSEAIAGVSLSSTVVGKAATSDPSTFTLYRGLCTWRITCGGTRAQIRWGVNGRGCFANSEPDMPLAVFLHGNGFGYRDYDYFQNHLAKNGILSISIDAVAANPNGAAEHRAVADRAEDFLTSRCIGRFFDRFPRPRPVDFQRTAIVGHSRGGESARYLNDNLYRNPDYNVRAVVAMAPTRKCAGRVLGNQTAAYMVLYGSDDPDVLPDEVFASHDVAGSNDLGTPNLLDLDRSMKLFVAGTHSGFAAPTPASIEQAQVLSARGYVNAFLRAWLLGDFRFYGRFIRGNEVPASWSPGVFSQYSDGTLRRPIDHFQHRNLSPNALGGPVWTSRMESAATFDAATLAETPHAGRVLRFKPAADNAYVAWGLPAELTDARPYRVLSFRIGRLSGSGPLAVRLWIENGSQYSYLDLGAFGEIPGPLSMCSRQYLTYCFSFRKRGHMRTFRVPLQNLGSHENVRRVYLQIRQGGVGDEFLMDNLELASEPVVLTPDLETAASQAGSGSFATSDSATPDDL